MNDIPITEAMIAWNPGRHRAFRKNGKPGQIMIVRHPDTTQIADHLSDTTAPKWDLTAADLKRETKADLFLRLKLMVEAWHIACRDAVPIKNIHQAFMAIPEYRELLSCDFSVREPMRNEWPELEANFSEDTPLL
jgi:hypothetical protein